MFIERYELSKPADQDLEDIFEYTEIEFGIDQAIEYLNGLESGFEQLIVNPELGRTRNDIKTGLRSISRSSHIIFYRLMSDHVKIVRVLHGSRDMINFL